MQIRKYIQENLKNAGVDETELRAETNFILENLLNVSNPYLDTEITQHQKEKLENLFAKRKTGMPLQYIIGIADFMGEKFHVDENVLIPRPETELLVVETIKKAKNFNSPKILDIGAGSGCIAIMLARNILNAQITSCDVSKNALEISKQNAVNMNAKVEFVYSDIFSDIQKKFDIIVSNPPYIPPQEKENIQKEVSFEPDSALYTSDEQGIEFYKKIISHGRTYLNDGGFILFELGKGQAELVKKIFVEYNYKEIEIFKDIEGNNRIICAKV